MKELSKKALSQLQTMLDQREKELAVDMQRESDMKDDYAEIASEAPDTGDSSFADLSTDLGNAALGRDLIELRAISRARERIANGSYGECIDCGYAIPVERLMAQPTAERCAVCQEKYEKSHGTGRGATL